MNRWAALLRETPVELQRLIARTHRIPLPRGCTADQRLQRLRVALCSAASVRAVYATLDAEMRQALDDLRSRWGGIPAGDLVRHYGEVRALRQMARDPQPRSVAERLIMLGWLLPRPAERQPPRAYLLAPEVRRWLPVSLRCASERVAPSAPLPPALRAAIVLLLACASSPLPARANGMLRKHACRLLEPLLALDSPDDVESLVAFVLPLLYDLGLVSVRRGRCAVTSSAAAFLDAPIEDQIVRLIDAWTRHPNPDRWLQRLRVASAGIDWPTFRRRLVQWVESVPSGRLFQSDYLCAALIDAFGPLADAQTHGFRVVRRTLWRRRSSMRVLCAALREPLHWLGVVAWHDDAVYRPSERCAPEHAWQYGAAGEVVVPFGGINADTLHLAQGGCWIGGHLQGLIWRITHRAGASVTRLSQILQRYAGSPPEWWGTLGFDKTPTLRFVDGVTLVADAPKDLERVLRSRSVRRYIQACLAPGIALARAEDIPALQRALERQGVTVVGRAPVSATPSPPQALSPGDCAALLVACAFYRRYAPTGMLLTIDESLESSLWKMLSPPLRRVVEEACADLDDCSRVAPQQPSDSPLPELLPREEMPSTPLNELIGVLRRAIRRSQTLTIDYDAGGAGRVERRTIRPLELDQRNAIWYLRAYCLRRQAERTFRVDRIRVWTTL